MRRIKQLWSDQLLNPLWKHTDDSLNNKKKCRLNSCYNQQCHVRVSECQWQPKMLLITTDWCSTLDTPKQFLCHIYSALQNKIRLLSLQWGRTRTLRVFRHPIQTRYSMLILHQVMVAPKHMMPVSGSKLCNVNVDFSLFLSPLYMCISQPLRNLVYLPRPDWGEWRSTGSEIWLGRRQ